ncbi:MAG: aspartate carbamoyltransferase catalytic subunit [Deltaproteobacteria bacterium]|nr:aspartate carbamoyltransferase catalytic subunit [Deltaproteobacteria bacterium]
MKHLLGIEDLSRAQIERILDTAKSMKEVGGRRIRKVPTLRGRTVVNLFFEASTRTRTSFEVAEKRLSADVINFASSTSSVSKGETLIDTTKNLMAMRPDAIVVRHASAGAPHLLARHVAASIVNAGDGAHEHPTQALLDAYTMRDKCGRVEGLEVAIVGDIRNSRVARSNILALARLGAHVRLAGPPPLIPPGIERLGGRARVTVANSADDAVRDADVVMMLRIQRERMTDDQAFPSLREYAILWGLNARRLALAKKSAIVMHPGPMNRGVEIMPEVADGAQSVILEQVENGVAVRMAVLYLVLGGGEAAA